MKRNKKSSYSKNPYSGKSSSKKKSSAYKPISKNKSSSSDSSSWMFIIGILLIFIGGGISLLF